jgi:hypothetical protein
LIVIILWGLNLETSFKTRIPKDILCGQAIGLVRLTKTRSEGDVHKLTPESVFGSYHQ